MRRLNLFSRAVAPVVRALPVGERVYAIGDIHGRLDLLDMLLAAIDADETIRGIAQTTLVFLGDLIDRGPSSRGVVERAIALSGTHRCVFLMGNHEEVLIAAYEGDVAMARLFHRIGGRATLLSYGLDPVRYDAADFAELVDLIGEVVPPTHIAFLRRFRDSYHTGDYLFVHAGVKPGVELGEQAPADMRWIRERFLDDKREHGAMIVHGHSISVEIDDNANRVGIDTGAYCSGVLTAMGLEGTDRWFLAS